MRAVAQRGAGSAWLAALLALAGCSKVPETAAPADTVAGLREVRRGMDITYLTADGRFEIRGDIVDLSDGTNLTEQVRSTERLRLLDAFAANDQIVFAPETKAAHVITVFTDIDCGFCRKLHEQVGDYNAAGIEVRYVPFPRSGPDTESFAKAAAVWCSPDQQSALTRAKQGQPAAGGEACASTVQRGLDLGHAIGLQGTPLLVFEDGSMLNGYLTAAQLSRHLSEKVTLPE